MACYLNLVFIQQLNFLSIVGHLALVLVAKILQGLLKLGLILFGQLPIDFADFDLSPTAGLCQLLLEDLKSPNELSFYKTPHSSVGLMISI